MLLALAALVLAGCDEEPAPPDPSGGPQRVSAAEPGSRALFPRLAHGPDGFAVLTWTEAADDGPRGAWTAVRPSGSGWGAPERLPGEGAAVVFDATVDSRGAAMVAVVENPGRPTARLRVLTRRPDAGWSPSQPLAVADGSGTLRDIDLAAGPGGEVVAVFERYGITGGGSVVAAVVRGRDGRWGVPVALERPAPAREEGPTPGAAMGADGRGLAVWERDGILAAELQPGGTWGAPRRIGAAGFAPQPSMAPDGRAVVVWGATDEETLAQVVRAAERPPGGPWRSEEAIYQPGGLGGGTPQAAMGPGGHVVVAFGRDAERMRTIHAALRLPRGGFPLAEPLSRPLRLTPPVTPAVAIDGGGRAAVAWAAGGPLTLSTGTADGGWSDLRRFGDRAGMPALAAAEGRVIAAWIQGGDEVWTVDVEAEG